MLKSLRSKDYSESPQSLGEHLKKRRKELGIFQREAATRIGIGMWTYLNWERDRTMPLASRFRPIIDFLGYDPTPAPKTLAERAQARRRELGVTFSQVARHLGWDEGTLTRYLNGTWRVPPGRSALLEAFLTDNEAEPAPFRELPRRPRRTGRTYPP